MQIFAKRKPVKQVALPVNFAELVLEKEHLIQQNPTKDLVLQVVLLYSVKCAQKP